MIDRVYVNVCKVQVSARLDHYYSTFGEHGRLSLVRAARPLSMRQWLDEKNYVKQIAQPAFASENAEELLRLQTMRGSSIKQFLVAEIRFIIRETARAMLNSVGDSASIQEIEAIQSFQNITCRLATAKLQKLISQGATLDEVLSKVGRIIDLGATYLYDPNSII